MVGILHDQVLVLPDEVADEGEHGYPDPGAQKGVERELPVVHPGQPRRKRDQVPHHRQQPADEGRNLAMLEEEFLHLGELLFGNEDVAAVLQEQRAPQVMGREVVGVGAHQAPHRAAQYRHGHAHLPLLGQIAGRRHHQFAGDRDHRTLHRHQQEDAGIPQRPYGLQKPINYCMHAEPLQFFSLRPPFYTGRGKKTTKLSLPLHPIPRMT